LRSFANGSSSLSMIVVATQICKRTIIDMHFWFAFWPQFFP
jgi:hypothetical protein